MRTHLWQSVYLSTSICDFLYCSLLIAILEILKFSLFCVNPLQVITHCNIYFDPLNSKLSKSSHVVVISMIIKGTR